MHTLGGSDYQQPISSATAAAVAKDITRTVPRALRTIQEAKEVKLPTALGYCDNASNTI